MRAGYAVEHFDRMQQRVTLGALREGARVVGVMVTIEDVTVRLDQERALAAELRSPDSSVRESAARRLAEAESIESPQTMTDVLRHDDWRVRRSAVLGLAPHASRDMLASLLTALRVEHADFNVLSSALQLLAMSEVDVTAPLTELLRDSDPDLRSRRPSPSVISITRPQSARWSTPSTTPTSSSISCD